MKTLFIEARKEVNLKKEDINKIFKGLPSSLGLLTTVQYVSFLPDIKKILEKQGKKVFIAQGKLTKYPGQILGCDISAAEKIKNKVDAFLFIGSGEFHIGSVMFLGKPVFVYSIEGNNLHQVSGDVVKSINTRKKSALLRFLAADSVGIIVSLKPGQYNFKSALLFKKKIEKKGKKSFIFIANNIDINELENFKCDAWINTSCQALNMEPKILNIQDTKI